MARKNMMLVSTGCGEYVGHTSRPSMSFQTSESKSHTSKKSAKSPSGLETRAESFLATDALTIGVE